MKASFLEFIGNLIFPAFITVLFIVIYVFASKIFQKQANGKKVGSLLKQATLGFIVFAGLLSVLLSFPFKTELKGQILSMVGIILSAAIALNSTTFLGNIFAGFMNKTNNHFKVGDFVYLGDYFGKVSDINLFHTEIQTQDRGLIIFSNIYIASNPVKVVRNSGTIISAEVTLGYDVSRFKIEKCLKDAAINAGLKDPFIFITSLGDFSVSYKINGLLEDVSLILTNKSKLNAMVLDELHKGNIEIVSPTFMNQRPLKPEQIFIPKKERIKDSEPELKAEDVLFDKANKAEKIEEKEKKIEGLQEKVDELKVILKDTPKGDEYDKLKNQIEKWEGILLKSKDKIIAEKDELDEEQ